MKLIISGVLCFFLFSSNAAFAVPIGFWDHGSTTTDKKTGLEWLDVSETFGYSQFHVQYEVTNGKEQDWNEGTEEFQDRMKNLHEHEGWDYLDLYESGWRYATDEEFFTLISNWFDVSREGMHPDADDSCGPCFYQNDGLDNPLFYQFTSTFGQSVEMTEDGLSLFTYGYICCSFFDEESNVAKISTEIGLTRQSVAYYSKVGTPVFAANESPTLGSFLVRPSESVPEPATFMLLIMGLLGLGVGRNRV